MRDVVIYRDIPILLKKKGYHIRKIGGRLYYSFHVDLGDIPVARHNPITNRFEPIVNSRGLAYAARNRQMYRKKGRK